MVTMKQKVASKTGKTIKIRPTTVERLDKLRHKGQSYDGVIAELLDYYEAREVKGSGHPESSRERG